MPVLMDRRAETGWTLSMDSTLESIQNDLARHHKSAATTVIGLLIATLLLCIVAYLGRSYFREQPNPSLNVAIRIVILILGLGSIAWRRTKFSAMRLQDIGALQGAAGLVRTLERTTLQLVIIAAATALTGFIGTLMTGDEWYTYTAAAIAIVVLLYSYPTKSSWVGTIRRFAKEYDQPSDSSEI